MSKSSRRLKLTKEKKDALWRRVLRLAAERGFPAALTTDRFVAIADPTFAKALVGEQVHSFVGTQCTTCSAPAPYLRAVPGTTFCWEFYNLVLQRADSARELGLLVCLKGLIVLARQGQIGSRDKWEPTDYVIASREDVLRTGLESRCRECGSAVFTSTPYPAQVSRLCEECFLVMDDQEDTSTK